MSVRHGYGDEDDLGDFLEHYPPMIYFVSGEAVQGREMFDVRGGSRAHLDHRSIVTLDWEAAGTDITAEARATASNHNLGISVHETVEEYLSRQPRRARHRWIICNDGPGEIADHVVIEHTPGGAVYLALWHSKAAGGDPGLRVGDFQVVVAQALRSRSRFNDPNL